MKSPTAIIVDDEPLLRAQARASLATVWPELEIVAEAGFGEQAIQLIETHRPEFAFLDIEMPGMSGLDVARAVKGKTHVVFITAYNQYALAAFERGAIDYLLKPASEARLADTVMRLRERRTPDLGALEPGPDRGRRRVPLELAIPALAMVAYFRLDRVGGVQLLGAEAVRGDLVAQAFPLLAFMGVAVVLRAPVTWVVRRSRRWGSRLPTAVWVALRRIGANPAVSTAVTLVTVMAVGVFAFASSMTSSARRLLDDKATTFLGADAVAEVTEILPVPAGLDGTVVARYNARSDDVAVDVIGVDPATFARVARWRDDGVACTTFWIGGADGVSQSVKDNADEKLAFGRQTWPHRLVRVMISEQIYRAVTILSGNPYHRD